jgi:hypothetical protein
MFGFVAIKSSILFSLFSILANNFLKFKSAAKTQLIGEIDHPSI